MSEVLGNVNTVSHADDANPDDREFRSKDVGAMRRRMHQAVFGRVSVAIKGHVFTADIEAQSGSNYAVTDVRLIRKLVRESFVLHHLLGVLPRYFSEATVEFEGRKPDPRTISIHLAEDFLLGCRVELLGGSNNRERQ